MSNWIILHNHGRFAEAMQSVLGKRADSISLEELIAATRIQVHIGKEHQHYWHYSGGMITAFNKKIIFQEVFYQFETALQIYGAEDRDYVRHSWQAYLLSIFAHAYKVINPVTPKRMTVSHYCFPNLCSIAYYCGFDIPNYEITSRSIKGYDAFDSFWYLPGRILASDVVMCVERPKEALEVVYFVRYDKSFITCWPKLPSEVESRLLMICNRLEIYFGQAAFQATGRWVFYGILPTISAPYPCDEVLFEMAMSVRDIGVEVEG